MKDCHFESNVRCVFAEREDITGKKRALLGNIFTLLHGKNVVILRCLKLDKNNNFDSRNLL